MYEFLDWTVQDVMSRPVTIGPDATLADAEALFEKHRFNALPVVDAGERLVGLVTSLDLLRAFDFPDDALLPPFDEVMRRPVSEILIRDVETVAPATPLSRVLQKIVETRNKSFPVLEGDRVIGMVAREDVMLGLRRGAQGHKGPVES
ncbi:MAG: CBS domain-containing protein [Myxococcota bacterium]